MMRTSHRQQHYWLNLLFVLILLGSLLPSASWASAATSRHDPLGESQPFNLNQVVSTRLPLETLVDHNSMVNAQIPNGSSDKIAFANNAGEQAGGIALMNSDGSDLQQLTSYGMEPVWSPDRTKIAFYWDYTFIDGPEGIEVIDADGNSISSFAYASSPSWSPDSQKLAYASDTREIYVFDLETEQHTQLTDGLLINLAPAWSPDGTKIAYTSRSLGFDQEIYIIDPAGEGPPIQLTDNDRTDEFPTWSPDGTKIAFTSWHGAYGEIYVMNADGSNPIRLTDNDVHDSHPVWSPDGQKIAFIRSTLGDTEIYLIDPAGQTEEVNLTNNPDQADYDVTWSPDSQKIAFVRDEGYAGIYVMNASNGSELTRLTPENEDAYDPAWSPPPSSLPLTLEVLDADGNPVNALTLNEEGWPTPNPLTVQVTLNCPAGGGDCINPFELTVNSADDRARFYVYNKDLSSVGQEECIYHFSGSEFSYRSYDCSISQLLMPTLSPGETRIMYWSVWVQPSENANLEFSASWEHPIFPELGYTDSKMVTIEQAQIHPIVFIHGLGAHLPSNDAQGWKTEIGDPGWSTLDAGLDLATKYTTLFETLEKMGYEEGRTLFFYNYDWLKSVVTEAAAKFRDKKLVPAGDRIAGRDPEVPGGVPWVQLYDENEVPGGVKFDVYTHSTGAMVARAYIQADTWHNDIRRLATVAGPHKGVPKIYRGWEGGDPDLGLINAYLQDYWDEVEKRAKVAGYGHEECIIFGTGCHWVLNDEDEYNFIHDPQVGMNIMPQFLPVRRSEDPPVMVDLNDENLAYPYDYQVNTLWTDESDMTGPCNSDDGESYFCNPYNDYPTTFYGLNTKDKSKLLDERLGLDNITLIYGNGLSMLSGYKVSPPRKTAPYWRNGEEVEKDVDITKGLGDGTVMAISGNPQDIWYDKDGNQVNLGFTLEDDGSMRDLVDNDVEISIYHNINDGQPSVFNVERMNFVRAENNNNVTDEELVHAFIFGHPETHDAVVRGLTRIELPPNFITEYDPVQAQADIAQWEEIASRRLMISVFSPVELTLTDSLGQRVGYDPVTGGDFSGEVPYGEYVREADTGIKSIIVMSPEEGEATLTLTGVGTGDYSVLGQFTDDFGRTDLFYTTGTVIPDQSDTLTFVIPTSSLEVPSPPEVQAGPDVIARKNQLLTFSGTFSDINPADTHQISWDFGDGETASGTLTPDHMFTEEGGFTVTLTVIDSAGYSVDDSLSVKVIGPVFQESDGQVVMEAEHFAQHLPRSNRAWSVQSQISDYSGESYLSAVPDIDSSFLTAYAATSPELQYLVNFATPGTYYVWLRGYAPNGAGDSAYFGLSDQEGPISTKDDITGFAPRQWSWTNSTTQNGPAILEITQPGFYFFRLWQREDGMSIDRMVLTTDSTYTPAGNGPAESPVAP